MQLDTVVRAHSGDEPTEVLPWKTIFGCRNPLHLVQPADKGSDIFLISNVILTM